MNTNCTFHTRNTSTTLVPFAHSHIVKTIGAPRSLKIFTEQSTADLLVKMTLNSLRGATGYFQSWENFVTCSCTTNHNVLCILVTQTKISSVLQLFKTITVFFFASATAMRVLMCHCKWMVLLARLHHFSATLLFWVVFLNHRHFVVTRHF